MRGGPHTAAGSHRPASSKLDSLQDARHATLSIEATTRIQFDSPRQHAAERDFGRDPVLASALDYRNTWITRAMGVCRHWRDTIVDAPVLWSKIDLSAGPRLITHYLTRSSNTGLAYMYQGPGEGK
ncbi:uncharacterized protein B0H18DRAFT_381839 [Fomitopsis serialis]|uniref:uncharacterized protein n=1 Tax=Fomitopsis serialis TaxID=139415 RepID=UPI0020074A09|nr:uncharacterized protein B0H18DRAFT_381839 [Neoantrodia serialis]KAH9925243.1 hypothetical protein B0H18DRAFT_381839 [Neoantrodia serialis]